MKTRLSREIELLDNIANTFADSTNLHDALESVLLAMETCLGFQHSTITIFDPQSERINIRVAPTLSEESKKAGSYKLGEGITGMVVETGKEVVVPDISKDPRFLHKTGVRKAPQSGKIAFFCVPIKFRGTCIGTLSADYVVQNAGEKLMQSNLRLLNIIAIIIAQASRLEELVSLDAQGLRDENRRLRQELKARFNIHNMVGNSNAIQQVYRLIEQVADSKATVLIRGESGTGKDLVAHAIHYNSLRADKPFVKVNCTALPETLLESELFGHEKGAFTGATERKIGRFELAHGGTIFLDEIGDFSLNLQVKLLRIIQFREFERVGGRETIKTNVRIIVATNKNLEEDIKAGVFREDLYYRINVFPIFLPPLRERKDDIMLMADFFLEKYARENDKDIRRISTPAIEMLTSYHWPGNVRELENCIERAVLLCNEDVIRSEHLPPSLQMVRKTESAEKRSMVEIIEAKERELIVDALKKTGGHQRKTAQELGITERMLGYKIKKYNILPKLL